MKRGDRQDELRSLIESIPGRRLAAKLRPLMPDISRRVEEGVQHQEIVDVLNEHGGFGGELKLATLRSYLFRYRKAEREGARRYRRRRGMPTPRATPAVEEACPLPSPPPLAPRELEAPGVRVGTGTGGSAAVTPSDLRRARDEEVDLEALAELGKATHTRRS